MDIKSILKKLKLSESTISMALGAVVIVIVGFLIVNYFKGADLGNTIPPIETEDALSLPTSHTVKAGEDLWKISEKYYGTGYNWVDIAQENDMADPSLLEEGLVLRIPDVATKLAENQGPEEEIEATKEEATEIDSGEIISDLNLEVDVSDTDSISTKTYTVVAGDTLWSIAIRAYGDGYRWTDIAKENQLHNPNVIHAGNVFVLPQ